MHALKTPCINPHPHSLSLHLNITNTSHTNQHSNPPTKQDKVAARNADYAKIARSLRFHGAGADAGADADGGGNGGDADGGSGDGGAAGNGGAADWGAGLRDADLLIWLGDFNYRIDAPPDFVPEPETPENPRGHQLYAFVHAKISRRRHLELLAGDQLLRAARAGEAFVGLAEAPVAFLPTYKFEKGRESSARQPFYDQGEKRRVPAWTDRVLFRGSAPQASALEAPAARDPEDVRAALADRGGGGGSVERSYGCCLEVNDSDHKPVYCRLDVALPAFEQAAAREAALRAIAACAPDGGGSGGGGNDGPQLELAPSAVRLDAGGAFSAAARLTNAGRAPAAFLVAGGAGAALGALPAWLDVSPAAGVVPPGGSVELRLRGWPSLPQLGAAPHLLGPQSAEVVIAGAPAGAVEAAEWPAGVLTTHAGALSLIVSMS